MSDNDLESMPAEPERALSLYEDGIHRALSLDLEGASRRFEEVIALDPRHVGARCNLGAILRLQGRTDEALGNFQQALRIDAGHARTLSNLGAVFHDQGRIQDAELAFCRAIRLDPTLGEAHYNLSLLYCRRQQFDRAWNHAREAAGLGMREGAVLLEEIERLMER